MQLYEIHFVLHQFSSSHHLLILTTSHNQTMKPSMTPTSPAPIPAISLPPVADPFPVVEAVAAAPAVVAGLEDEAVGRFRT